MSQTITFYPIGNAEKMTSKESKMTNILINHQIFRTYSMFFLYQRAH